MSTSGYAAAIDTGDLVMSYGAEATWGSKPAVAFQEIRLDGEGFSSSKSRTRPNEISPDGQASAAITTKEESTGSLNFSVSAGTHNELIASSLGSTFSTPLTISATTIAATATGFTDSANGFTGGDAPVPGQMIKVSGFTTTGLLANGVYRVDTVAVGEITTTPAPGATKIAGDTVVVKGSMLRNGTVFQSFFFQKFLASNMFLTYPGSWPTGGGLDVGVGDYLKGTLSFLNKSETSATTDGSTGASVDAPTGTVIDSVGGIGTVYRNGAAISAIIQKIGVKWNKEGARAQYGIGSSAAQGMGKGKLLINGSLSSYFKDFSLYSEFKAETGGPIWFQALDNLGNGYVITICNATIMNPKIVFGGPNQDVMADFEMEGNPGAALYGGKTIQIDYFSA
jgi:hypothetical protein